MNLVDRCLIIKIRRQGYSLVIRTSTDSLLTGFLIRPFISKICNQIGTVIIRPRRSIYPILIII